MDQIITTKSKEVYSILGFGHRENAYRNGLTEELRELGLNPIKEYPLAITYKGHLLTTYYPDIVINNNLPIEIKWIKKLGEKEYLQITNYMRYIKSDVGYLINFGYTNLEMLKFTKNEDGTIDKTILSDITKE